MAKCPVWSATGLRFATVRFALGSLPPACIISPSNLLQEISQRIGVANPTVRTRARIGVPGRHWSIPMQETNGMLVARKPAAATTLAFDDPSLYINRELSWLAFNRRVLEEALDPTVPLLERIKFLAIFASNLDEFFMVRVGGLQQKVAAGINVGSGADRTAPRD